MNKKSILTTLAALVFSTTNALASNSFFEVDPEVTVSVPETSSFGLLLIGLVGLGIVAYRNRKK